MTQSAPGLRNCMSRTFTLGQSLAWCGASLAVIILGAHFFRASNTIMLVCAAGTLMFHCSQEAWKRYATALFLCWGVMEWGHTAHALAVMRMHFNTPWAKGVAILAAVGAYTGLAVAYSFATAKEKHRVNSGPAIAQAVSFMLSLLALYALQRYAKQDILLLERFFPRWGGGVQTFLMAWYAAIVAGGLSNRKTSAQTRKRVWLFFSLIFFGQFALGALGVPHMLLSETPHIPHPAFIVFAPIYRGTITMMPFLALFATLLAGGAWCSMLCYFGALDSAAGGGKQVKPLPPSLRPFFRYGRAIVLLLGAAVALTLRFSGAPAMTAASLGIVFMVGCGLVMAFLSRKYAGMAHCSSVCPMGLLVNAVSKLSPWRVRVDAATCDNCGACERVCSYRAMSKESRMNGSPSSRCVHCRDCIGKCPKQAVSLKSRILPDAISEQTFIVFVVIVHVVFLASARM